MLASPVGGGARRSWDQDVGDASVPSPHNPSPAPTGTKALPKRHDKKPTPESPPHLPALNPTLITPSNTVNISSPKNRKNAATRFPRAPASAAITPKSTTTHSTIETIARASRCPAEGAFPASCHESFCPSPPIA